MSWMIFTLIAMFLWTAVNILDKYIIGHELKDPYLVTTVFGFSIYLLFIVVSLVNGSVLIPLEYAIAAIVAGVFYSVAMIFYYGAMKGVEVSRLMPIFAIEPIFIGLFAFLFFAERLFSLNYIGIALVLLGVIIISYKKINSNTKSKKNFYALALIGILFFTFRNLILKFVSGEVDFWPMIFWFGVGGIFVPIIVLIVHHPHIRKQAEKGIMHLCIVAILSGLALISFTKAISLGSVTLVSALLAAKPMLVFLVATFLSFFHPKIIREKHTPKILLQKIIAIALIVAGSILVLM